MMQWKAFRVGVSALLFVLACQSAWAIGPDNQTINPTFDSVVRVLFDSGLGGGIGEFSGTGTVIGNANVNGEGWLCVLTADHVVSNGMGMMSANRPTLPGLGIAFGNSGNDTGNSAYLRAQRVLRPNFNDGPKDVDIAVLSINYGLFNPLFTPLVRTLVPATAFFFFSDVGYGEEGKLNLANSRYDGQGKFGTQRYFNDKITLFQAGFNSFLDYNYEAAVWFVTGPNAMGAIAGTGAAFPGDSGSPLFSSETNGTFFTNNEFGVVTAGETDGMGNIPFGAKQFAVALTRDQIAWIEHSCAIPEPASVCLFGIGVVVLVGYAFRRRQPQIA